MAPGSPVSLGTSFCSVTAALSTVTAFVLAQCPAPAPGEGPGLWLQPSAILGLGKTSSLHSFPAAVPITEGPKRFQRLGRATWLGKFTLSLSPGAKHPQVGRHSTCAHPKHTHRT